MDLGRGDAEEKVVVVRICGGAFTILANSQRLRCISENAVSGSE
jgi:hypothetical protein